MKDIVINQTLRLCRANSRKESIVKRPKQTEIAREIKRQFRVMSLVAGGVACVLPHIANAQQVVATETASASLATVVVTAQKRSEPMQEVPVAISVVSSQEIENRGISGFTELLGQMPNTVIEQSASSQPSISIRGLSSSVNNIGMESGVGVAIDDVFLGRPSAFSTQLIDIERVEVLRGPQGTLFGKNTIGGLVNIVTSKPSQEFAGAIDYTTGTNNLQQVRGYLTGAVGGGMAAKISFTSKNKNGWVENRNPAAADLMTENFKGVRAQLSGGSAATVSWLLSADHSKDNAVENYYDIRSGALAAVDPNGEDRSIETNGNDYLRRTIQGVSLKADWKWSGLDFTSITARRGVDWEGNNDQDYTILPILQVGRKENQTQVSQEFRVANTTDRYNWLAGIYLFKQKQSGTDTLTLDEGLPDAIGIGPIPGYQEKSDTYADLKTKSSALFLSGKYKLTDAIDFNGGIRYTKEDKDIVYEQRLTNPFGLIDGIGLAAPVAPISATRSDSQWSGDVGFGYKWSKDVNSYAKISKGFKAGGFTTTSASSSNPGDLSFEPESVTSYEVGIKSIFAGGKIRMNAAAFTMDYNNKQEQFFNGVHQIVSNAAKAKIEGFEIDFTARPTRSWLLGATLGYQEAKYASYPGYDGNRLTDAPRITASLSVQYDHQMSNEWSWFARADARYRDMSFQQPDNDPVFTQPASTLVNLSAGLRDPSHKYSLIFWVKNATDETYRVSTYAISALGTTYQSVNPPRMIGLELRANF